MPPNAGIGYVEGQRVVLGGAMTFNFAGDYASHQKFYAQWVNEQAGEYEKAGQEKIIASYNREVGAEKLRGVLRGGNITDYLAGRTSTGSEPIASNGPDLLRTVRRGNLIGLIFDGVRELFVSSGSRAITAETPLLTQLAVNTVEEVKAFSKSHNAKRREGQTGSYTIHFSNGMKYHGKGPVSRMVSSATSRMTDLPADQVMIMYVTLYRVGVTILEWTPAQNDREAFKQEYRRMQTDATLQYLQGVDNPIKL